MMNIFFFYLGLDTSLTVVPFTERKITGNCGSFKNSVSMNQFVLPFLGEKPKKIID